MQNHHYQVKIKWTGNNGTGTSNYTAYSRDHELVIADKPPIYCSADAVFRGDAGKHNPEELFLYSLSSCHMLWYLHLCADAGIVVVSYTDEPTGTLSLADDSGKFTTATLNPIIVIESQGDEERAINLHNEAHAKCFIANSCNFPIDVKAKILTEG